MERNNEEYKILLKNFPHSDIENSPDALLELLWSGYASFIPATEPDLSELEPILNCLSRKRAIMLLRIISEMRVQHEKEVFCAGLRMGAQLMSELWS